MRRRRSTSASSGTLIWKGRTAGVAVDGRGSRWVLGVSVWVLGVSGDTGRTTTSSAAARSYVGSRLLAGASAPAAETVWAEPGEASRMRPKTPAAAAVASTRRRVGDDATADVIISCSFVEKCAWPSVNGAYRRWCRCPGCQEASPEQPAENVLERF